MEQALGGRLGELVAGTRVAARLDHDPLRFALPYARAGRHDDAEVAALFAAMLAFGRVRSIEGALRPIFARMDGKGGPAAFVDGPLPANAMEGLYYRWHKAEDLLALCRMAGGVRARHGRLGALFRRGPLEQSLHDAIVELRRAAGTVSPSFRRLLPSPRDGSACKRWCMLLRWMVRREAPDLGLWTHLDPADLVVPLDTHVFRLAGFLGLRSRATPGWRTAVEITANLARFSPGDPLRYDFALAHHGISGACAGFRVVENCRRCPLDVVCSASPTGSAPARPGRDVPTTKAARTGRRGRA
jgi:uncharacterized protein (TIGR02757 family)